MPSYGPPSGGTPVVARPPGPRPTGPARPQPITHAPTPAPRPAYTTKVTKPPRPAAAGPRGHWVPVGDSWVLVHATGPNQWARGGVAGHKAPPKPVGQTPLPNNPLAPLTQGQIQRTATKTVTSAYGGDLNDLNDQTKQAQNLYATQAADDHAFSNWLVQQTANLNNSVSGTNQKLSDMVTGLRQSQATALGAAPGAAAAASESGSQAGVSGQQTTDALNRLTAPATTAANGQLAGAIATAAQNGISQQQAAGQSGDIAQARVQATQNTELGNLNKTLTDIASERTKTISNRTGDIAKEIARLQGVELSKRQFLINQGDAEKAAGISQQNTLDEIAARDAGVVTAGQRVSIAQQQANTAETRAQQTQMNADRTYNLNVKKFGADQAKNMYELTHGLGPYKPASTPTAASKKPLTASGLKTITSTINQLRSALQYDIQTYHGSDKDPAKALDQAYHDLTNISHVKGDKNLGPLVGKGIDVGLLNAAYNSMGNGLTPGDIQYLQQSGTWNPGNHYKVASQQRGVGQAIASGVRGRQ